VKIFSPFLKSTVNSSIRAKLTIRSDSSIIVA
jgi:hypothetical protein